MSKTYTFLWDMGYGSPIEVHFPIKTIAWLIGTHHLRNVRVWTFNQDLMPQELIPMINQRTHEVALMDPATGKHVECATYPYVE